MTFLEFLRTWWPVAVVIMPLVTATGFIWLKTQFPTKADLDKAVADITDRIDAHDERLETGSKKLADLDKRVAIVEEDCDSQPTKNDLNQGLSIVAGRISGMEAALKGLDRRFDTQDHYLRVVIEKGLAPPGASS